MKSNLLILFFIVGILRALHSQNDPNLVRNGDFENITPLPSGVSCGEGTNQSDNLFFGTNQQTAGENYWSNRATPWTIPDKPNVFSCEKGAATSDVSCSDGPVGPKYGFVAWGEFFCQELQPTAITPNHSYHIEFYARKESDYANHVKGGMNFLTERPKQCGTKRLRLPARGGSDYELQYTDPTDTWFKFTKDHVLPTNYTWINFGFGDGPDGNDHKFDALDNNDLSFDGIKIVDVGTSWCQQVNYIQNLKYENIGRITYRSSDATIAGNSVDPNQAPGDVISTPTAIVRLQSATLVSLMPGFSAQSGTEFQAMIIPCEAECPGAYAEAGNSFDACGVAFNTYYQLGGANIPGQTYTWSVAQPTNVTGLGSNYPYLQFLTDPNIANPSFVQPNGDGVITYMLTVTNTCGETATDYITINVDNTPVANPVTPTYSSSSFYGNYDPVNHTIDFTFGNLTSNTESIYIQVYDKNGNLVNEYEIDNINGSGATSYHFSTPGDYYADCGGNFYTVKVYQKNHCSEIYSTPLTVNINPGCASCCSYYSGITIDGVPNIFTPNGDGANDIWFIGDTPNPTCSYGGATGFHTWIYDRWGTLVFDNAQWGSVNCCAFTTSLNSNGNAYDASIRWSGVTNRSTGYNWVETHILGKIDLCNGCMSVDGTYFYVQEIYRCGGTGSWSGWLQISGSSGRYAAPTDTIPPDSVNIDSLRALYNQRVAQGFSFKINTEPVENYTFDLIPNPATEDVMISIPTALINEKAKITITNAIGQIVIEKKVDMPMNDISLRQLQTGIYSVRFSNGVYSEVKRLVKS